jgi:serine-type D-Ala-D-Ala carboxypeptidase/endopeptidase
MKKITCLFIFLFPLLINAQDLKDLCRERVDLEETPGIAVAWLEDGKVNYYNYGFSNIAAKQPVSSKTLFEIGSITKTFTCSVLSLLVVRKELALDDAAQKYLSTIKLPEKNGKQITLLNLATAHSGLSRMPTNFSPADPMNPYVDYTEKQLSELLSSYKLSWEPGYQYEYSNLGMGTLGFLLTQYKKTTYSNLVRENLFRPLGMKQTFISGERKSKDLATGYADKAPMPAWTWADQSVLTGAGGIVSNTEDMMKYLVAQLENSNTPLNNAFKEAHKERTTAGTMQIGLGWHIKDHKYIWHNGGTGGFRSFAGFDPEKKRAIVILTNSTAGADDLGFHWLNDASPLKPIIKTITLEPTVLKEYEGVYEIVPQFKITVTVEGTALMAQATNQPKFQIYAEAIDKFFFKVVPAKITFERNSENKIEKLTLHQNGQVMPGRKIIQ